MTGFLKPSIYHKKRDPLAYNVHDYSFIHKNTVIARLYVSVGILLTRRKYLHDCISSLRGDVCAHKTSLTPQLFIEVPVPRQESDQSCICVLGVSIVPVSTILIFDFEIVPTVWYFFSHCVT